MTQAVGTIGFGLFLVAYSWSLARLHPFWRGGRYRFNLVVSAFPLVVGLIMLGRQVVLASW